MSEAYENVRAGRLAFKGGELATRDKSIDKKKKKKKNKSKLQDDAVPSEDPSVSVVDMGTDTDTGDVYTRDPMKKMKYDELFPVETRRFGYDPKAKAKSVEEALDDWVKKKADRYCDFG